MNDFSNRLLTWWQTHGRHDLPWQAERTPYRVWVAEIMLQQTRVATVIGYFERFMAQLPDLPSLAQAELDEVLALWSGLGYYARARHLHAAARQCMKEHDGKVPDDPAALEALPGIGRSTANAIVAQAFDRPAPILDGNAKRVLARHAGIAGWPGRSAVLKQLWREAERRTPNGRAADYTQAIMDLGATLCTPRRPDCAACPVNSDCTARREDRIAELPGRQPPRHRPRRELTLLVIENDAGQVLLERRPPAGIWGGLWCLPASESKARLMTADSTHSMGVMEHHFTHFVLDLHLQRVHVQGLRPMEDDGDHLWTAPDKALEMGLPRPIRSIMETISGESS